MGQYVIRKVCFFGPKKMFFMQIELVLQTKNRFSAALVYGPTHWGLNNWSL